MSSANSPALAAIAPPFGFASPQILPNNVTYVDRPEVRTAIIGNGTNLQNVTCIGSIYVASSAMNNGELITPGITLAQPAAQVISDPGTPTSYWKTWVSPTVVPFPFLLSHRLCIYSYNLASGEADPSSHLRFGLGLIETDSGGLNPTLTRDAVFLRGEVRFSIRSAAVPVGSLNTPTDQMFGCANSALSMVGWFNMIHGPLGEVVAQETIPPFKIGAFDYSIDMPNWLGQTTGSNIWNPYVPIRYSGDIGGWTMPGQFGAGLNFVVNPFFTGFFDFTLVGDLYVRSGITARIMGWA